MNRNKSIGMLLLIGLVLVAVWFWPQALRVYAVRQIESAKRAGVYRSPEEGMRALIASHYRGIERIEIDRAGTNSFDGDDPHVWFVSARVYAASRADGQRIGADRYDYPGSYFLRVEEEWVHVPEGAFPEMIGDAMSRFNLYGCDSETNNCR